MLRPGVQVGEGRSPRQLNRMEIPGTRFPESISSPRNVDEIVGLSYLSEDIPATCSKSGLTSEFILFQTSGA